MEQKALLSMKEAADMLWVSRRTVERLIASGQLRPRRMGGRTLVPRKELQRLTSRDVVRIWPRG